MARPELGACGGKVCLWGNATLVGSYCFFCSGAVDGVFCVETVSDPCGVSCDCGVRLSDPLNRRAAADEAGEDGFWLEVRTLSFLPQRQVIVCADIDGLTSKISLHAGHLIFMWNFHSTQGKLMLSTVAALEMLGCRRPSWRWT